MANAVPCKACDALNDFASAVIVIFFMCVVIYYVLTKLG
jgi:hypothetical protein